MVSIVDSKLKNRSHRWKVGSRAFPTNDMVRFSTIGYQMDENGQHKKTHRFFSGVLIICTF